MTVAKNYEAVKALIDRYPELVDDDERLVANFWIIQLSYLGFDFDKMSAWELMMHIKNKTLLPHDTITRMRRLVEEKCPHLRGKTWEKRQRIKEKKIRTEIVSL